MSNGAAVVPARPAIPVLRRDWGSPIRGMGTHPYDAGGHGRRAYAWNPTTLGQNTLLYSHGLQLVARSRDAVRNSGWASCAIDSYVANAIGNGIRMVSLHPDAQVREMISTAWNRWIRESDQEYDPANPASGQTDFYGQQAIIAREVMEAGEAFVRFRPRPKREGMQVPIQLQLIESEQLPIWRMTTSGIPDKNAVRSGIEFQPDGRRAAYHFWRAHPGETMFFPLEGLQVERVPARDILHVYRPIRAGQLRGQPWLTSVMAKLYELEQYSDAEIVRKKTSAMITGFIKQISPDNPIVPADPSRNSAAQPGEMIAKFEPGSFPILNPGEEIQFASAPDSGDFAPVVTMCLRAFASGAGLTFEQVSGDLSHVNYSSIRAGLLEFRRKCEQFQHSVFIFQVCHPVFRRWMFEAMMALAFGVEMLNQYTADPRLFDDVSWVTPGWPWVDPEKDINSSKDAIRCGLSTRSLECAAQGRDSVVMDQQQDADNKRADGYGILYDSDPRKVITGKDAGLSSKQVAEAADQADARPA